MRTLVVFVRRFWLPLILLVAGAVIFLLLIRPGWAYQWDWTGFGAGRSAIKDPKHPFDYYPTKSLWDWMQSKSLWDWMQLLVIPAVLVVAGFFFNRAQQSRERDIAAQNRAQDLSIADERQQEAALETYLATMTTLLLDKALRTSREDDEVRAVARAQTLTVLKRLNGERKGSVVRFLYESNLLDKDTPIVALYDADLGGADLFMARLGGADLIRADLRGAFLGGAKLGGADLGGAFNITDAQVEKAARSLAGTTLPSGKKHP